MPVSIAPRALVWRCTAVLLSAAEELMRNVYRIACTSLLLWAACDPGLDGADSDRGHVIALGSQLIDIRATAPDTISPSTAAGDDHALVKFSGPVTTAQLQALQASAQIYTYLPHDTFLVRRLPGATMTASPGGAAWTGAYKPAYKISRAATELAASG